MTPRDFDPLMDEPRLDLDAIEKRADAATPISVLLGEYRKRAGELDAIARDPRSSLEDVGNAADRETMAKEKVLAFVARLESQHAALVAEVKRLRAELQNTNYLSHLNRIRLRRKR